MSELRFIPRRETECSRYAQDQSPMKLSYHANGTVRKAYQ